MVYSHQPVLLEQTLSALSPKDGELFVDCTLGGGGHSEALLSAANCRVIGLDRDPAALEAASRRLSSFGERFQAVHARFSELPQVMRNLGIDGVDGILADIGVSSHQLDTDERGFSFRRSGPIDMRMDPTQGESASHLVHEWTAEELADVFRRYGEEPDAWRIAKAIVAGRPYADTVALAEVIASAAVRRGKRRIHPATRTFQALRIAVNGELSELESLLGCAVEWLHTDGRLAIISFHSLEDRLVKRALRHEAARDSEKDAWGHPIRPPRVRLGKPATATDDDDNPRARSARLRSAVRLPCND
jgi:16S rRNA (cytosine1402-N4)-methyltransferase